MPVLCVPLPFFTQDTHPIAFRYQVETDIPPVPLLRILKQVEVTVGRIPSLRYGPRAVDLDLLFHGDAEIDTRPAGESNMQGHLVVPHPAIAEREFVLRPLNEWVPLHNTSTAVDDNPTV